MRRSYRGAPGHSGGGHGWHLGGGWGLFLLIVLLVVILGALGLAFVPGMAGAGWRGNMGGRGGSCPWCGGRGIISGWGVLGTLLALALGLGFIVLLAVGAVSLIRRGDEGGPLSSGRSSSTARDLLDQRYARGEISEEEHRRMVEQIEN